jgi:hypothetical protein
MHMSWRRFTTFGAVASLGLVGCGGGDPGDRSGAEDRRASSASSAGPVPEGTWSRVVTTGDADALGVDAALASEMIGPDGEMPLDLEVVAGEWKLYVTSDEGERELGDFGTWSTGDGGRWLTRSESPGCRGCEAGYLVSIDGNRLTTEVDDGNAPAGDVHLVTEGTWTRQT